MNSKPILLRHLFFLYDQVKAQDVWSAIVESQIETGTPYMLYKDACNSKSNQQNLGCIKVNTHMRPPF